MKKIATVIVALIFVVGISVVGFWLKRNVHYSLSYQGKVEQTICQMVKPEHLSAYGTKQCQ